jgi:hypothetical protein
MRRVSRAVVASPSDCALGLAPGMVAVTVRRTVGAGGVPVVIQVARAVATPTRRDIARSGVVVLRLISGLLGKWGLVKGLS